MSESKVRLADIAKHTGYSLATVSKAGQVPCLTQHAAQHFESPDCVEVLKDHFDVPLAGRFLAAALVARGLECLIDGCAGLVGDVGPSVERLGDGCQRVAGVLCGSPAC